MAVVTWEGHEMINVWKQFFLWSACVATMVQLVL